MGHAFVAREDELRQGDRPSAWVVPPRGLQPWMIKKERELSTAITWWRRWGWLMRSSAHSVCACVLGLESAACVF